MQIDRATRIAKDARILLIDDQRMNVTALGQILDREGYAICISMTDPRKAVAQFLAMQPDLVLLDWHMEALSGAEVLLALKKAMPEDEIPPVLVLTADDSPETKREALAAGATDFLAKPFDYSEVLLRIRNLLQLRMLHLHAQAINRDLEQQVRERTSELERTLVELRAVQHQVVQHERLRALGTMAGGIAHDFNNALTVIKGYGDMFPDEESIRRDPAQVSDCFTHIRTAANDAAEIVRRLREFYRPYEKGEDDHCPVDVNAIVEDAVQLALPRWKTQPQASGIFIDLQTHLSDVPKISGAASELREVLMNLIFNAVDAMPQGGQIVVRTGVEDGSVFLEIEDSGTGMTEETRRHCLEPFYTTKGERGTGLGLSTTYGIVRRHGGIIRVDTELNQGTNFVVLLPIGDAKEMPAEPLDAGLPIKPLRVLVVDDQPDICHVVSRYLEEDAHTVETACNGCEALEKFRAGHFDIVITDRAMPKMNGDQLATAIKEIRPDEPIILLTAFADEPHRPSPDIDVLISKPASLRQIREAIGKALAGGPN